MKVFLGPYEDNSEQREVSVDIDAYDTWSADHTLALIIEPMLRQLKETQHGAPYVDPDDCPKELRPNEVNEHETDDTHFARWAWVLDEMIFAFATMNSEYEDEFWDGHDVYTPIETVGVGPAQLRLFPDDDGSIEDYETYEMKENPNRKVKFDKEGLRKIEERMDRGFKLFGKYYRGLWD